MTNRIKVTREQLRRFIPDIATQKQFENLFGLVNEFSDDSFENDIAFAIGQAKKALISHLWKRFGDTLLTRNPNENVQIDAYLRLFGSSDTQQLILRGNSTQTSSFALVQDSASVKYFEIEANGTLSVGSTLNYETLVTDDDDIPNKKYVDDGIYWTRTITTLTTKTANDDLQIDSFLKLIGSSDNIQFSLTGNATQTSVFLRVENSANVKYFEIESNGTLSVGSSLNYETLVTNDDDIPNKKYVDDSDFWIRSSTTLRTKTANDDVQIDSFLRIIGDADEIQLKITGNTAQIANYLRLENVSATKIFAVEGNGVLSVGASLNYEILVTDDDDIPNKKYVDDGIYWSRSSTTISTKTANDDVKIDSFLRVIGSSDAIQLIITGNSTQTSNLFRVEDNNGVKRFEVESDGTLSVGSTLNYETLVTDDDDIPNKAYIDKPAVTRKTFSDTPYTAVAADRVIFFNTDGGNVTLNLPAGVSGKEYRIVNTGSTSNQLSVAPNGSEDLLGANSAFTLNDAESLIISYDSTDGWY